MPTNTLSLTRDRKRRCHLAQHSYSVPRCSGACNRRVFPGLVCFTDAVCSTKDCDDQRRIQICSAAPTMDCPFCMCNQTQHHPHPHSQSRPGHRHPSSPLRPPSPVSVPMPRPLPIPLALPLPVHSSIPFAIPLLHQFAHAPARSDFQLHVHHPSPSQHLSTIPSAAPRAHHQTYCHSLFHPHLHRHYLHLHLYSDPSPYPDGVLFPRHIPCSTSASRLHSTGLVLPALCLLGSALAPTYTWLLGFRFLQGVVGANVAINKTYVAEVCDRHTVARGMSLLMLPLPIGQSIGLAVAGYLHRFSIFVAAAYAALFTCESHVGVQSAVVCGLVCGVVVFAVWYVQCCGVSCVNSPPSPPSRRNSAKLPKTKILGAALIEECHAKWNDTCTANTA